MARASFWALGEIVKAAASRNDAQDVAIAKLDRAPEGAEQAWFHQRLLPLLIDHVEREPSPHGDFLEHIAEQHPTVLVFEDLHWADEAMLAFWGTSLAQRRLRCSWSGPHALSC
jgi:hypothetical protein